MHGVRSGLLRPPRGDEKNVYNDEAKGEGGEGEKNACSMPLRPLSVVSRDSGRLCCE